MDKKENIAKCPLCGGDITESEKGFGCSNWRDKDGGCKFVIWKKFSGREITKEIAKELIKKKKTGKIPGWISKRTGKEFEAALKLEINDDESKVVFDFDE